MKGTPAIYLGRIVKKKHFRAFIYGLKGEKKLVESWDAFEIAMQSGIWFAEQEDVEAIKANANSQENMKEKPKSKPKPKLKVVKVEEEVGAPIKDDGMVFEVTDHTK